MKKYIPILVALFVSVGLADSVEFRTGDGHRTELRSVNGTFESRHESQFPYVCYDKRIKVVSDGDVFVKYKGCTRVRVSCKSLGRVHFGKYPNDYKASQALDRCYNARPRFID